MEAPFGNIGKFLIIIGSLILSAGLVVYFFGKIPFFGKLPGDIMVKKENFTFYFPLATSILISVIISVILFLINKFR